MKPDLEASYDRLRAKLQALQEAPVKDFGQIDQIIEQLEKLQLAIKARHGIQGNNPNE